MQKTVTVESTAEEQFYEYEEQEHLFTAEFSLFEQQAEQRKDSSSVETQPINSSTIASMTSAGVIDYELSALEPPKKNKLSRRLTPQGELKKLFQTVSTSKARLSDRLLDYVIGCIQYTRKRYTSSLFSPIIDYEILPILALEVLYQYVCIKERTLNSIQLSNVIVHLQTLDGDELFMGLLIVSCCVIKHQGSPVDEEKTSLFLGKIAQLCQKNNKPSPLFISIMHAKLLVQPGKPLNEIERNILTFALSKATSEAIEAFKIPPLLIKTQKSYPNQSLLAWSSSFTMRQKLIAVREKVKKKRLLTSPALLNLVMGWKSLSAQEKYIFLEIIECALENGQLDFSVAKNKSHASTISKSLEKLYGALLDSLANIHYITLQKKAINIYMLLRFSNAFTTCNTNINALEKRFIECCSNLNSKAILFLNDLYRRNEKEATPLKSDHIILLGKLVKLTECDLVRKEANIILAKLTTDIDSLSNLLEKENNADCKIGLLECSKYVQERNRVLHDKHIAKLFVIINAKQRTDELKCLASKLILFHIKTQQQHLSEKNQRELFFSLSTEHCWT